MIAHDDVTMPGGTALPAPTEPAAPSWIEAAELQGLPGSSSGNQEVDVAWQNTPKDETGYVLQRSIDSGPFEDIKSLSADETAFTDSIPNSQFAASATPPTVAYRVEPGTPFLISNISPTATVALSRGGPDVTADLMAMAADVHKQFASLSPLGKELIAGASTNLPWAWNYWDIFAFPSRSFHDIGIGRGQGTATVAGKVFDQQAVNYWLAGLIYVELCGYDANKAFWFRQEVWANIYAVHSGDTLGQDVNDEKWAWFNAGAAVNTSLPQPPSYLTGLLPGPKNDPTKNPVQWDWGWLSGND